MAPGWPRALQHLRGKSDHGDAEIESAQRWLRDHFAVANPVEEMIKRSNLAERTFKRRFALAAGLPPIAYVQRPRIEDAKRRFERTDASVDEISWRVGYEDSAFFRRLFKRMTGLAPGRLSQALSHPCIRPPITRSPGAGREPLPLPLLAKTWARITGRACPLGPRGRPCLEPNEQTALAHPTDRLTVILEPRALERRRHLGEFL